MIIQDENGRGGLPRAPVGRERGRYGTRQGLSRHPAARGVRRAGTQANCTDDVREKIDGPQIQQRQEINLPAL